MAKLPLSTVKLVGTLTRLAPYQNPLARADVAASPSPRLPHRLLPQIRSRHVPLAISAPHREYNIVAISRSPFRIGRIG